MNRNSRLEHIKQLLIDHLEGLRVVELSRRCGVDRRTIYRDLEAMQKMGLPVWQHGGRFGIERERYMASLRINLNEAFALWWALRLLNLQTEMEYPHAQTLLEKLATAFPPDLAVQLLSVPQPSVGSNKRALEVIEQVSRAWADNVKVMVWYRSGGKTVSRIIWPYLLDTTPQAKLYVLAMDENSRQVRALPLSRILQAKVLHDQPFKRPSRLDLGADTQQLLSRR